MDYATARPLIQDGDLILERSRKGLLPWLTRIVTRSPYTHAAVALWLDGGLWVAEINGGGNHLIPLSQIRQPYDVFRAGVASDDIRCVLLEMLREHDAYSIPDLLVIALRDLLALRVPYSDEGLVCSGFAATALLAAGWGADVPKIPSPADLAAQFTAPIFEVTP